MYPPKNQASLEESSTVKHFLPCSVCINENVGCGELELEPSAHAKQSLTGFSCKNYCGGIAETR
jgi:hypothetical protein